jgi:2-(1,2-epoxy-1,2-dihydrophenyl)acetyl-CoA isomerase
MERPLTKFSENNSIPSFRKIRTLEKPVVGAINGVAAGAGANLAWHVDVVVASESASFVQAFSKIWFGP